MGTDTEDGATRLSRAARVEARTMLAAVARHDERAEVRISVAQFRTLARLIEKLASESDESCGGTCMGAPVDGFRFWVPVDQLRQARASAAMHEAAAVDAQARLRRMEAAPPADSFRW